MVNENVLVADFDTRYSGLRFSQSALRRLGDAGPGSWVSWWSGMSAEFFRVDERARDVAFGSAPANTSVQVVTVGPEIVGACREVLGGFGEFLPVETERGTYWAFHCLNEVFALDEEASEDLDFVEDPSVPGGRRLLFAMGMAFHEDVVREARVFVLPEEVGRGSVYFSREVVEELQAVTGGFTGTSFRVPV